MLKDDQFRRRRSQVVHRYPVLRDQEILWVEEYERRLGDFLSRNKPAISELKSRMVAASLVTAFRYTMLNEPSQLRDGEALSAFVNLAGEAARWYLEDVAPQQENPTTIILTTTMSPSAAATALAAMARGGQETIERVAPESTN
jgi:hypothetical protein